MHHVPSILHRNDRGFSLVEQIAALAIAAVLVAAAVPTMAGLVVRSASSTTQDALFMAARLARTTAITHNTHVLLCPSADGRHCSGNDHWQAGWIVVLDRNHDGKADAAAFTRGVPDHHVRVIGSGGRKYVRFRSDGDAAGTNVTLLVCPRGAHPPAARVVIVSNAGRIREHDASKSQRARCPSPA